MLFFWTKIYVLNCEKFSINKGIIIASALKISIITQPYSMRIYILNCLFQLRRVKGLNFTKINLDVPSKLPGKNNLTLLNWLKLFLYTFINCEILFSEHLPVLSLWKIFPWGNWIVCSKLQKWNQIWVYFSIEC